VLEKLKSLISGGLQAGPAGAQCKGYEARLEDYLQGVDDSELNDHLRECAGCRAALETSRMGGKLLRDSWEPTSEARDTFLAGVMARIREEKVRAESPAAFWNPLEFLASRVSLTAAAVLFVLSVYMVGFAPRRAPSLSPSARTELNAADFPQPPGDPDSNEEVLQSLVERNYGEN
jgi:predicted anti-sigma-YlaC factor YlaD